MGKVSVFNTVSVDGFFTDVRGDMSWAHKTDPEWIAFASDNAKGGDGMLLFGRVTYEMMASYWPTEQAKKAAPLVARGMNDLAKVVFSRSLDVATWNNTRLVKTGLEDEVRTLKRTSQKSMTILGSGSIVSQLAREGLIDEYQLVVSPIILGKGRTLFEGADIKLPLKLVRSRSFQNGNVVLWYEPA